MLYFLAFLIFVMSILVHEFGHYLTAKLCSVNVQIFSLGFGPKIFGFKLKETEYRLSAIPLGGYVKLYGSDIEKINEIPKELEKHSFLKTHPLKKILIIVSGSLMNFLFMYLLLVFSFMSPHECLTNKFYYNGQIAELISLEGFKAFAYDDLYRLYNIKKDNIKFSFKLADDEKVYNGIILTTESRKEILIEGKSYIVFNQIPMYVDESKIIKYDLKNSLFYSIYFGNNLFKLYFGFLKNIKKEHINGPIGMTVVIKRFADQGLFELLIIMALLNLNLGIFNLLPIPVLDGGYFYIFILEWIAGRTFSSLFYKLTIGVGFSILIVLFILGTYNDLMHFIFNT